MVLNKDNKERWFLITISLPNFTLLFNFPVTLLSCPFLITVQISFKLLFSPFFQFYCTPNFIQLQVFFEIKKISLWWEYFNINLKFIINLLFKLRIILFNFEIAKVSFTKKIHLQYFFLVFSVYFYFVKEIKSLVLEYLHCYYHLILKEL